MPVDLEYLRQHYASLSDEALLEIDRSELVEAAQKCYEGELAARGLGSAESVGQKPGLDKPGWLDEASEVYSRIDAPGAAPGADLADARDALESAGIPCHLERSDVPAEQNAAPKPTQVWRLMVPGDLNLHATSVLERDIFNAEFEAQWKTHLEMLSDEELQAMDPQDTFCGLFDRIERVTRAFDEEIARRGL